jgi:hypothetical protein
MTRTTAVAAGRGRSAWPRHKAAKLLRDSPSLRPRLPTLLEDAYPAARIRAGVETLPEETFPAVCPFTLDQIIGDWPPEE